LYGVIMVYGEINIDKEIMGGTPVFNGTRVPIKTLFDYLEGGETLDEFLDDFPTVEPESAKNFLKTAYETMINQKVLDENFVR
jgi:uncharacterized protein (DUF433 family)